jgi:DNA-directed RNA polymerase subunit RPC12/RpoP
MTEDPEPAVRCAVCGRVAGAQPPPDWTLQVDRRGRSYVCAACTREHVRAIEGQLDQADW